MTDLFKLPFDTPAGPAGSRRRILTVSELTRGVRLQLEAEYAELWVEGEISNARVWKTGHLYFTLKDETAQLKAVMFRSALRHQRFRPTDGQHVIARGRLGVYEPKGEYQLVCEHLEPHGVGALQLAFDQLREKLAREGLFETDRKRALPPLPRKIGVVTSLDGAALRDIITVLGRRYPNVHIVIGPARVQGEGAAAEISRRLRSLSRLDGIDVIIVGRGGGSIEDLWAFNEESVARAIAEVPVPVISAVGHETDFTISDFVADVRAPTPSAAAELVVAQKDEIASRIARLGERLRAALRDGVQQRRRSVHHLETRPGLAGWPARVAMHGRRVDELEHRVTHAVREGLGRRERQVHEWRLRLEALDLGRRLGRIRTRLVAARGRLASGAWERLRRQDATLGVLAGRLQSLSPLGVLARGYAVCWDEGNRRIIRDADTVNPGDHVHVTLQRGTLDCEVKKAN